MWRVGSSPTTVVMSSIIYNYTPQEMQDILDNSTGYGDVLSKLGLNPKGRNPDTLKKYIHEFGLDETKLNKNRHNLFSECAKKTHKKTSYKTEDILNNMYPNYQSAKLLKRLIDEGYKKYKCEICGISEWNSKHISLQLHHINGNHQDNTLSNLQVLCPNCHSQMDSFGGKSSQKSKGNRKKIGESKETITSS